MDLDANCSTLGANAALAEIVAKHIPEAYIGPAAHAVPPNLSHQWISAVRRCSILGEVSLGAIRVQNIDNRPLLRIAICIQQPGSHYVWGGGWEL